LNRVAGLAGLLLLVGPAGAAAPARAPSFAPYKSYATGDEPRAVAVIDLNGDGKPEIVSANHLAGTVSMFVNRGRSFAPRMDIPTRGSPLALSVGDLNRDGKMDIVTADGDTVSVLLNHGDGTFPMRQDRSLGDALAEAVAVGDLNGDGTPDLATIGGIGDPGVLSVLQGLGDGTFGERAAYATERHPVTVAIGDVNGDRKPDVVTASARLSVSVFSNSGAGTFGAPHAYRTGAGPDSVGVGDLNRDGKQDIVTANAEIDSVSVLLNERGGFARRDYETGGAPVSVGIGDMNGDGRPDLATANDESTALSVVRNTGRGTFQPGVSYRTRSGAVSLAIADLNGDGRLDAVSAHQDDDLVSVLLNKPGLCTVQGVRGMRLAAAKQHLARANCRVGSIRRVYSSGSRGRVLGQKPRFGAVLPDGGKVDLVVSRGLK